VVERFGRLDICVANAGGFPAKRSSRNHIDDWRAAAELNVMSTVYLNHGSAVGDATAALGRFIAITPAANDQPVRTRRRAGVTHRTRFVITDVSAAAARGVQIDEIRLYAAV
jgi:NAD(P)-dependent dehydrogenase (short-subunit alcohol dehydrogenase family)